MNIIEAARLALEGKKVRQKMDKNGWFSNDGGPFVYHNKHYPEPVDQWGWLWTRDLLSEDWEIVDE